MKYVVIDWLEFYCIEPQGFSEEVFFRQEWLVDMREYGTRIYRDVWTVHVPARDFAFEVRRGMKSSGVMADGSCHIRVQNRSCYTHSPAQLLWDLLTPLGFIFRSVSRVDLASDFVLFDSGLSPKKFLKRVLNGNYRMALKTLRKDIVQCTWQSVDPNYISYRFGDVVVRIYDKSLELRQVSLSEKKRKNYILALWMQWGLIPSIPDFMSDSCPHVYRLEFQIQSSSRGWIRDGDGQFQELDIDTLCSASRVASLYACLVMSYFQFHTFKKGSEPSSASVVDLFRFGAIDAKPLHPVRPEQEHEVDRKLRLLRFLAQINVQLSASISEPHKADLMRVQHSLLALLRSENITRYQVEAWKKSLSTQPSLFDDCPF